MLFSLTMEGVQSYLDSVHSKIAHASIELSWQKANREFFQVVQNDNTVELELVATITNMGMYTKF